MLKVVSDAASSPDHHDGLPQLAPPIPALWPWVVGAGLALGVTVPSDHWTDNVGGAAFVAMAAALVHGVLSRTTRSVEVHGDTIVRAVVLGPLSVRVGSVRHDGRAAVDFVAAEGPLVPPHRRRCVLRLVTAWGRMTWTAEGELAAQYDVERIRAHLAARGVRAARPTEALQGAVRRAERDDDHARLQWRAGDPRWVATRTRVILAALGVLALLLSPWWPVAAAVRVGVLGALGALTLRLAWRLRTAEVIVQLAPEGWTVERREWLGSRRTPGRVVAIPGRVVSLRGESLALERSLDGEDPTVPVLSRDELTAAEMQWVVGQICGRPTPRREAA